MQCYCKLPAIPWITINIIINTVQYSQFYKYNGTHTLACTQCTVPGLIHTMSPGSWSNRYTGMLWDWSSLRSGHQDPNSKTKRFDQPVDIDTNPQNSPLKKVTLCLIKWIKYNQTLILRKIDNLLLTKLVEHAPVLTRGSKPFTFPWTNVYVHRTEVVVLLVTYTVPLDIIQYTYMTLIVAYLWYVSQGLSSTVELSSSPVQYSQCGWGY